MSAVSVGVASLPRTRGRAVAMAAAVLWLPCTVPFFVYDSDPGNVLPTYLKCFVAVPGMIFPVLLRLNGFWFGAVAVAATMAGFAGLYVAARELPRHLLLWVVLIASVLLSFEAVGFMAALRA